MVKRPVNIIRFNKTKKTSVKDIVLIESPIEIVVNSEPFVNIICLPNDLKELAIGFLFTTGIINIIEDIKEVRVNELENLINVDLKESANFNAENLKINPVGRIIDSSCGISSPWRDQIKKSLDTEKEDLPLKDNISLHPTIIFSAIKEIYKRMDLYRETGGCHGAAIFTLKGEMVSLKEDIGRHNAIDKVFGDMLLNKRPFKNIFLITSGRLTGDSVLKAIRAKIPIVASVSAAIESGIRLAFTYGITLIGFVRGARMNIYTHPHRITG